MTRFRLFPMKNAVKRLHPEAVCRRFVHGYGVLDEEGGRIIAFASTSWFAWLKAKRIVKKATAK